MPPIMMAIIDAANKLNYIEQARIGLQNQCRSLSEVGLFSKLSLSALETGVCNLEKIEKEAVKALELLTKQHPLWTEFFAPIRGCGEKSAGRLLGLLGDPLRYTNQDDERVERTVGSLWHYCGYAPGHDKRKRGEQGSYNPHAREQLYVIAECFIKGGGDYRDIYDVRKAATEGKPHSEVCKNTVKPVNGKPMGSNGCGTQAHPEWGEIGSPWRDGHRHKDAIRFMMKAFLKDLFVAAQELEQEVPLAIAA